MRISTPQRPVASSPATSKTWFWMNGRGGVPPRLVDISVS
jgi:hypothetical protein